MDSHEVTGAVKEASGAAERGYGKLRSTVSETVDRLRGDSMERFENGWSDTKDAIREYPAQSLGIALVAGFAIGALIAMVSSRKD